VIVHQPGCMLDSVHWFRHAVAAAGHLAQEEPDSHADRVSAMSLADSLAHFAELDDWATVTLRDVADHATLMTQEVNKERFNHMCTCGALD
jgi:hypothetical protein